MSEEQEQERAEYEDYQLSKKILLEEVINFGVMSVAYGHRIDDKEIISTGNVLSIISSIIKDSVDIFELEAFIGFYSSKKIMETITIKDIFDLRNKKLGEESGAKLLDELGLTYDDLDNTDIDLDNYLPNDDDDNDD